MPNVFYCKCSVCGIEFISHSKQRTICNKCSTGGSDTKEAVCKKCGKTFLLYRNPNDENKFEKKTLCPDCRSWHCEKCGKVVAKDERLCSDCKTIANGQYTRIENGHYYSKCSKCGCEIEVNPNNKHNIPNGKFRKLCDKCHDKFMKETKDIVCKSCGKKFTVGRSLTDGGFLIKDYCPECYNKIYHPEYITKICEYCGKEFKIYPNNDGKFTRNKKYCPDCEYNNPIIKQKHNETCKSKYGVNWSCLTPMCQDAKSDNHISKLNLEFAKLLEVNKIKYEMEWLDIEHSRHYDFYLPESDILLEINPSYTHSMLGNAYQGFNISDKQIEYKKWQHLNRTQDINKRVIHVWDWDDWQKIINLIKPKERLYARKLKIKSVNSDIAKIFLEKHHLQGNCRNKTVNLGLYQDEQLVELMVFGKPRYNNKYEWELLRLCTHSNYIIVGGANKIFKYFTDNYKPKSIISYCDYSKFTGDVYTKLGFKFVKLNYPSKIWSKGSKKITDSLLRQRGFDQLFKTNYGKGTSNEQLMLDNYWLPVYDCGQKVFEYIIMNENM